MGGVVVLLHLFLTWALGGVELSTSRPGIFTAGKEHWDPLNKGIDGPQTWSGGLGDEKYLLPVPGFKKPDFPVGSPVPATDFQIHRP